MGICKYCNKDAGFLRHKHEECEEKFNKGKSQLTDLLTQIFLRKEDFYIYDKQIKDIITEHYINQIEKEQIFVAALDAATIQFLNDNLITPDEERVIARFIQFSEMQQRTLNKNHSLSKVVQSSLLQELTQGKIPAPRFTLSEQLPILLQKNEQMLWLYKEVDFYQTKTHKQYAGRSSGLSFRIAKGVYYRVGGFKGNPIETTSVDFISRGIVCLTNKNFYFSSQVKGFKIPLNKIIILEPYSDGIGLQKDGLNSNPLYFKNMDSWFICNAVSALM